MATILRSQVLRWVGHMVRMDPKRLQRKLLFGWVNHPRRVGRPMPTFGERVERLVEEAKALVEPEVRRLIDGSSRTGRSRRATSTYSKKGIGWVKCAYRRREWRMLANAGRRFDGSGAKNGNGSSKKKNVSAAVAADVARARAARDR